MAGAAESFGTRGLVAVRGTSDAEPFERSFTALGDGTHTLPINAGLRERIPVDVGDTDTVHRTQRLSG